MIKSLRRSKTDPFPTGTVRTLLCIVALAPLPGPLAAQTVTIYRDRFGTPSIVAERLADAMYGLGYAMAQDSAEQMARNFKQARGRRAEIDGPSQVLPDTFVRSLCFEARAEKGIDSLPAEAATAVRRFCDGANRALAEQRSRLPAWIEPFTPTDVLALAQLAQAAFPLQEIAGRLAPGTGSNQFAIAPKRTASGHAILSIDPHLSWSGTLVWYEYAIYSRAFDFQGITLCGLPMGTMGHTDFVAWSMTNNNPRLYDVITVTTNPANPNQYSYHGEWRDFELGSQDIRVLDGGKVKTIHQTVRRTAWGPMIPLRSQAVRLSSPDLPVMFAQALQMARAKSAREFRKALMPRGLSMWNIVYADTQGHIGYQYNARLPHRSERFDWTKPVPGADPDTKWGELWTLDALPHAEDPAGGLLINANSSPWLTTLGREIPSTRWPAYVTSFGETTRYDRLKTLLASDSKLTVGAAQAIATDTQVPFAVAATKALKEAIRRASAAADANRAGPADPSPGGIRVLNEWNGRADIDSIGCALYLYWLRADPQMAELARRAAAGEEWTSVELVAAVAAFRAACADLQAQAGRLEVPWGEIHLSQRGARTAPVNGLAYFLPADRTATVAPNYGPFVDGRIVCDGGSSYRMIVDLDPKGIRSCSALPFGDSQDPASPHFADQQAMFGRGQYRDSLFGLATIRRAAVSRITISTK